MSSTIPRPGDTPPELKRGDSLSSPRTAQKEGSFFSRRAKRRRTRTPSPFDEFPQVIKDTPIAASSTSSEDAMRAELRRKDDRIGELVNALIDANHVLNGRQELNGPELKRVRGILDLEVLLEGQKKRQRSTKVDRSNRNGPFVENNANALIRDLKKLAIATTRLREDVQQKNGETIELVKRCQECRDMFFRFRDGVPLEGLLPSFNDKKSVAELVPAINNKIRKLRADIAKDQAEVTEPKDFQKVAHFERKPVGVIADEVAKRKEITENRIRMKDDLVRMLHIIQSTEQLLAWHIDDIVSQLVLLSDMERYHGELLQICERKAVSIRNNKNKPNSREFMQDLQYIASQLNVIDKGLYHSEQFNDSDSRPFMDRVRDTIAQYQEDLESFDSAAADLVEEKLKQIQISDAEIKEEVCREVAANMLAINAEKEQTLNKLKAFLVRLELAEEKARWSVESMHAFGGHSSKIEVISAQISQLVQDLETNKEEMRRVARDGGEYKTQDFQDNLARFIDKYNGLAEAAKELYDQLEEKLDQLTRKIDEKSNPEVLENRLNALRVSNAELLESLQEAIIDFFASMIAIYKSEKHELAAKQKIFVKLIHQTLPLEIDRLNYVLQGNTVWSGDLFPRPSLQGKSWNIAPSVQSPFSDDTAVQAASSSEPVAE